ncbi:signal peptidase I [Treponema sp.]|uniref:signal peptidase I n=1 Tax=Treponema sp. TaxID=166 RepID=UPI003F0CD441
MNIVMEKKKSEPGIFKYILIGIAAGIILKFFIFDILDVRGISMEPAIHDRETIIVFKLAYGIVNPFGNSTPVRWKNAKVNDIVVYFYNNNLVVKRCVATEGDSLEYSLDSGYTLHVGEKNYPLTEFQYNLIKTSSRVPKGMILAIGDNAENSVDSRIYGFVAQRNILGKVIFK